MHVNERIARQIERWNTQPLTARRAVLNALEHFRDWCLSRPDLGSALFESGRAANSLIALVEPESDCSRQDHDEWRVRAEKAEATITTLRTALEQAELHFRFVEDEFNRSTKATRDGKDLIRVALDAARGGR